MVIVKSFEGESRDGWLKIWSRSSLVLRDILVYNKLIPILWSQQEPDIEWMVRMELGNKR